MKYLKKINEDLTDSGIPQDFINKAKEGKPTPSGQDFGRASMESFHIINKVKQSESNYTDDQLKQMAINTVKMLFSHTKDIDINNVKFDLTILERPSHELKRGLSAGVTDIEFKRKRDEESEETKKEIDKRRIINALTQGFALASQEEMIMSEESELPAEIFQDYFTLMNVTNKTHWNIPTEVTNDPQRTFNMMIPLGTSELKYDEETEQYTIKASGFILIVLIHEMVKGVYEIIAMHSQTGKSAEELAKIYKLTDTLSMETEGLKFGPALVKQIRTFYDNLENGLIKKGKITKKQNILASILATLYTYPAARFVSICEKLFSTNENDLPYAEFESIYMSIIGETEHIENDDDDFPSEEPKYEKPKINKKVNLNLDDILDKIYNKEKLTPEEQDFLNKQ